MTASGILALALVVALIVFAAVTAYAKSYVITFDGRKVSVQDYIFCYHQYLIANYMYSETDGKEEALDRLLTIETFNQKMKENGLTLSEDDMAYIDYMVSDYKSICEYYNIKMPKISEKRLTELSSHDVNKYALLDVYTAGYSVDEADFAEKLAAYLVDEKYDYADIQLKYIFAETEEAAQEAYSMLTVAEIDFDTVAEEYARNYLPETGLDTMSLSEFYNEVYNATYSYVALEILNKIANLSAGDYSDIIQMNDSSYIIVNVLDISFPDESETSDKYRERYTWEQKEAIFQGIVEEWVRDANYTLNKKGYDNAW